jgi:glutamate synthase (NADPH/NADH) large chain
MTLEDMELILSPMVEDAKEAVGSMGDDTPLAVLSDKPRRSAISSARTSAR